MTEVRNLDGLVTSFNYGDILSRYRAGDGHHMSFDASAFMVGSLGRNVRPTSFRAFDEVSAFVRNSGQATTIDELYRTAYRIGIATTPRPDMFDGNGALRSEDDFVRARTGYNYQSYYDGDFSAEGRFNKFVWGTTSYNLKGTIRPDGSGGVTFDGSIKPFNDQCTFQEENKTGALASIDTVLRQFLDPLSEGTALPIYMVCVAIESH
jgi:hypothetical protein